MGIITIQSCYSISNFTIQENTEYTMDKHVIVKFEKFNFKKVKY